MSREASQAAVIRHGDVYLVPERFAAQINPAFLVQETKQDADGRSVLAYGETSGHYHAVEGANIVASSGGLVLDFPDGGVIRHLGYSGPREHADLPIPAGRYVPIQQHEWNILDGWRAVAD